MDMYIYDSDGLYVGQMQCQLDPLETKKAGHEVFLIPANSTTKEPPKMKDGFFIVWNGEDWEYREIPKEDFASESPILTLEEIKTYKITELKIIRDAKEVELVKTNKGIFDYDDKSRNRLAIARQALEDAGGGEIVWTTADNQRVPLGVSDFAAINSAAALRSNDLHIEYNRLKEQVLAANSKEDVEAIFWDDE